MGEAMTTSPIRYLGWRAVFETGNYTVTGVGDTQSEALLMLRSAWAEHCRTNLRASPDYLGEYIDDVNYEQVVIPSGKLDGKVITTLPVPSPTVERIVLLAKDPGLGSPVRISPGDRASGDYGNAWSLIPGEEWVHSPDVFSYDEVCRMLTSIGVQAYTEQTGGGCATIYAGPLVPFEHASFVNGQPVGEVEIEQRYKIAAGPGTYGWDRGDSVGSIEEFYMGPNDDGESESLSAADLAVTNTRQLAAYIALLVIDAADFDNVTAIGLDATQRGIPQNGA
jgi:hypothetical protein